MRGFIAHAEESRSVEGNVAAPTIVGKSQDITIIKSQSCCLDVLGHEFPENPVLHHWK
jgi:hypothetical protein